MVEEPAFAFVSHSALFGRNKGTAKIMKNGRNGLTISRAAVHAMQKHRSRHRRSDLDERWSPAAPMHRFPAPEARRLLKRLQFHHTPKHASWLKIVKIEIGVLRSQCLDRRIDDKETILTEVAAWEEWRNAEAARIQVDVHHREGSRKAPQSLSRQGVTSSGCSTRRAPPISRVRIGQTTH
jgi:hypothetical protein